MSSREVVAQLLASRRAFRACKPALDSVTAIAAAVRARAGLRPPASTGSGTWPSTDDRASVLTEVEGAMRAAAYQASIRTALTIRQRSLAGFLR